MLTLEQIKVRNRKELRNKMAEVFSDKIKTLPAEIQYILLDDLVTAFESRLSMFSQVKPSQGTADFEFAINREKIIA